MAHNIRVVYSSVLTIDAMNVLITLGLQQVRDELILIPVCTAELTKHNHNITQLQL